MNAIRSLRTAMNVTVNQIMWQIAATPIGQNSLGCLDRILKIVRDLNFVSAPLKEQQTAVDDCEDFKDSKVSLGWFFSLPLLFFFRIARICVSLVAWPFGMRFSAMTAAYYINAQRRQLRHYKTEGARRMDTIKQDLQTPWLLQKAIVLFIYGPLNFFQFFVCKLFRNPSPCQLSSNSNVSKRAKRSSKETKTPLNAEDMTTLELLELHAAEEDNLSDDPDFEVKSQDLNAVSEEDEDDDLDEEERANSGPEEDLQPNGKDVAHTQEQENNQNPGDQQHHHNHENNNGGEQPQDNPQNHHEQGHHDQHHHHDHHHHHY